MAADLRLKTPEIRIPSRKQQQTVRKAKPTKAPMPPCQTARRQRRPIAPLLLSAKVASTDTYANTTLIWKNTATGQEVAAKDMVFVSTAFPAGSYVFKFTSASGRSCNASVDITAYDISDNLKLTLEITVPN
jgi:hypothetical protein